MPIYTNDPYDDGLFPVEPSLRSSIGIGPKVTKAIDAATKDWLDNHPEATTTVKDDSLTNAKFMDGSVNSRVIENESITTNDIADLAVTTPKIADNAVTADKVTSSAADGLRIMSTTQPGVAKVGAGLAMNGQALELDGNGDIATAVTSWLNAHPEATTTVQDGAITDAKLVQTGGVLEDVSYLVSNTIGENLYNPLNDTVGVVISSDGTISNNALFRTSDFIPYDPGSYISLASASTYLGNDGATFLAWYGSEKNFLQRVGADQKENGVFTTLFNGIGINQAYYFRVCSSVNANPYMVNTGTGLLAYSAYYSPITRTLLPTLEDMFESKDVITEYLAFDNGNMYDYETDTLGIVISSTGEPVSNASFRTSELIPYTSGEYVSIASASTYLGKDGATFIAWYNSSGVFMDRGSADGRQGGVLTTRYPGAGYFRLCSAVDSVSYMVNSGESLLPYSPYDDRAYSAKLDEHILEYVSGAIPNIMTRIAAWSSDEIPNSGEIVSDYEGIATYNPTLEQLYGLYDGLVSAYPDYVSKKDLGLDQSGLYHLYQYSFIPETINVAQEPFQLPAKPKMLIGSGTHGDGELGDKHEMVVGLYYFLNNICKNWKDNDALAYLRWQVQFEVIPVQNPWGYVNNNRKNSRGVDINRNFSYGWTLVSDTTSASYGGPNPFSEAESVIIRDFIEDNLDAISYFDIHTTGSTSAQASMFYIEQIKDNNEMCIIANDACLQVSRKWNNENISGLTDIPFHGYLVSRSGTGQINHWAYKVANIPSCVFEGFPYFSNGGVSSEGNEIMKMCLDEIISMVLKTLRFFNQKQFKII